MHRVSVTSISAPSHPEGKLFWIGAEIEEAGRDWEEGKRIQFFCREEEDLAGEEERIDEGRAMTHEKASGESALGLTRGAFAGGGLDRNGRDRPPGSP